ncbi:small heat shock protein [Chiua virens]|nr:small heat shock protein [Chiua virens]
MSLTTHFYRDPWVDFDHLFDNAFTSRFMRPFTGTTETGRDFFKPRMDVFENAENNTVTATFDLPGVKREDVNIDVNQNRLIISGQASASQEQVDESGYTVRERSWGKFSRSLMLPQGIKIEDVRAKMENGVLNVTFPKGAAPPQPKRITIE